MSLTTEQQQLIDDCEAREQRLSDFERGFIDSIGKQLAAGRNLSRKQADLLDDVWQKATAQG